MSAPVHIALVHHPVHNKEGRVVATAVTNLDIHDNARSARTFGVSAYHIVTPLDAQLELVSRILGHWREGFGARRVPTRGAAMELVAVARSIAEVEAAMAARYGEAPRVIATCARAGFANLTHAALRDQLAEGTRPHLLLFGTGYGLASEVLDAADAILEPIGDPGDWNHLSVRSAVAIILDRLLGR